MMRDRHFENWLNKIKFTGLALVVFAFASLAVSGQAIKCALTDASVSGATDVFTVTVESTTLTVVPAGQWASIERMDTNDNVQVTFTPATPSGNVPVVITASEVNAAESGDFAVVARDTNNRYLKIFATANCKPISGCTRTPGYWKNHAERWPVTSLSLGTVSYSQSQLLNIFRTSTKTNGLVTLAHQLIAAKLNVAAGTGAPASILTAITDADAMIGGMTVPRAGDGYLSPRQASLLTSILDEYNNGRAADGPPHCDD